MASDSYYPQGSLTSNLPTCPDFSALDDILLSYMRENGVPGLSVAIGHQGSLCYQQYYGWASHGVRLQAHHKMRIASVSKVITAVAVMKLCEEGKLHLHDKVFGPKGLLAQFIPTPEGDRRLYRITVRHLLQHSGGHWDREMVGDPVFWKHVSTELGVNGPVSPHSLIHYMMQHKLQFTPGTRHAYSNLGYLILGRVIEQMSGQAYGDYVTCLLASVGLDRVQLGKTFRWQALQDEVEYYASPDQQQVASIYPDIGLVSSPYGSYSMESGDADGGWIACPADLITLLHALDGTGPKPLLKAETFKQMLAKPSYAKGSAWYGLGLDVTWCGKAWEHGGHIDGATSHVCRDKRGYTWALLCNYWPPETDYSSLMEYGLLMSRHKSTAEQGKESKSVLQLKMIEGKLESFVDVYSAQGYRITWISSYVNNDSVLFNAIWRKDMNASRFVIKPSLQDLVVTQKALAEDGYVLDHIDVYFEQNITKFACIFTKQDKKSDSIVTVVDMDKVEICLEEYKGKGYIPKVLCPFVENSCQAKLCALLEKNPNTQIWYKLGLTKDKYESDLKKQIRYGHLLTYIKAYRSSDTTLYSVIWSHPGPFHYTADHDMSYYRVLCDHSELCMDKGFYPLCIAGYIEDKAHRYVMVCVKEAKKNKQ